MTDDAFHERFEHTADVGLRVRAGSLDALFAEAGRGLCAMLVEDPETVRPVRRVRFRLEAEEPSDLLVDWLSELIVAFETEGLLLPKLEVSIDGRRLEAVAWGEELDPRRHRLANEVKAATYHGLKLAREPGGWVAEVILDI